MVLNWLRIPLATEARRFSARFTVCPPSGALRAYAE
jgi:hypothetical protein